VDGERFFMGALLSIRRRFGVRLLYPDGCSHSTETSLTGRTPLVEWLLSLSQMLSTDLQLYRGASVLMKIDGKEALGVPGLRVSVEPVVTTLCYVSDPRDCPLIQHWLTEREIAEIEVESRNRLISTVSLRTDSEKSIDLTKAGIVQEG